MIVLRHDCTLGVTCLCFPKFDAGQDKYMGGQRNFFYVRFHLTSPDRVFQCAACTGGNFLCGVDFVWAALQQVQTQLNADPQKLLLK
jgi:hypothetical protein